MKITMRKPLKFQKIKITVCEYNELIALKERVSAVERIVSKNGYITGSDLIAVLDLSACTKVGEDVGKL